MTSAYSELDIVCFYVDLGRDYAPLMADMTASAHKAMPGCRTLLMSPNPPPEVAQHFDGVVVLENAQIDADTLCMQRGRAHLTWMLKTDRPALLSDPDIIFRSGAPIDRACDVGLNWRGKPDQPVNSGVVFARPNCHQFWRHYGAVCVNLPKRIWFWWADQLAFSLMTGVCHQSGETLQLDDARVSLWRAEDNCSTEETVSDLAWAIHRKGRRKGPGWEDVFTQDNDPMPPGIHRGGEVS